MGNKCDLESKRVITYSKGEEVSLVSHDHPRCVSVYEQTAAKHNIKYIETSARTNYNVDEVHSIS